MFLTAQAIIAKAVRMKWTRNTILNLFLRISGSFMLTFTVWAILLLVVLLLRYPYNVSCAAVVQVAE